MLHRRMCRMLVLALRVALLSSLVLGANASAVLKTPSARSSSASDSVTSTGSDSSSASALSNRTTDTTTALASTNVHGTNSTSAVLPVTTAQATATAQPVVTSGATNSTANAVSSGNVTATSTGGITQPSQTSDPTILDDIATIRSRRLSIIIEGISNTLNISSWLSTLGENGKWPDSKIDYTTGCNARRANWPAEDHWSRIVSMAGAWHGGVDASADYVNSSTLLDAISRAMDFWFANDFTVPGCLDSGGRPACPCGTPGFWNTNWFSNIIGIPEFVGEACLLIGADTLAATQVSNCTHILNRAFGTFGRSVNGLGFLTGANTLDVAKIGIDSGLLVGNASMIADGYARIHTEVVVQNAIKADGIRADGSFGQHGGIIYNGNYGKDYTNDVLALEIAAAGTQYSAQNAGTGSQAAFEGLLDGDLWMIYRNVLTNVLHWDFSVLPRFISFPVSDNQATASIKINISQIEELGTLWGSDALQSVSDSLAMSSDDANAGRIKGNRMFYANDYMVQRGSGYVSTLRMYSRRTQNSECVNSQNPFGFHLSDGTLYTYLQGNEYEDIAAAWDWNLIPGTTTNYAATNLSCDHTQFTGKEAFVGGASDGRVGVAAMRYTNPFTGSLSFQKAWFFLDDDVQHVVVSRADSNASESAPVISVLDQKRLSGRVYVDGRALEHGGNFSHARTLWHDGVGYVFDSGGLFDRTTDVEDPDDEDDGDDDGSNPSSNINSTARARSSLSVDFGARSGNWASIGISAAGESTADLFSAWLTHGAGSALALPAAYTAFPGTSLEAFARKRTAVRTVRSDDAVTAVYDGAHRTAVFVFWEAQGGEATVRPGALLDAPVTVAASANAAVIYRLDEGAVTVADPGQSVASVRLTFTVGLGGARPKGWGRARTKTVDVVLPAGGAAGRSVSVALP